ncbi:MAG: DUF4149 domain-containing protein [Myxococcota bacterium]|nr:DUF4149 domain-containing protein [Myxococcota bacterium]
MGALAFVYRWVVGTWVGALFAFGALFAPALFRAMTPPEAGAVVRQVIPALDALGLGAAAIAVAAGWLLEGLGERRARARLVLLALAAALAGVSAGWVSPRMATLRAQAGAGISSLSREDPVRREFGRLHGASSGLMLLEWLLVSAALALAPVRGARRE